MVLEAYRVITFEGGVPYAWLVPRDPIRPEWIRMEEAGHSHVYAEVIADLEEEEQGGSGLASAVRNLAAAIRYYADRR
jgi:hypothetical protein